MKTGRRRSGTPCRHRAIPSRCTCHTRTSARAATASHCPPRSSGRVTTGYPWISTRLTQSAPPPEAGERFSLVRTSTFKEFTRFSTVMKGVTWVYRLSVNWEAGCVRDTYTSLPSHHIHLTMYKDPSVAGYRSAHDPAVQSSLALNMYGKAQYVFAPRGDPTTLYPDKYTH